MNERHNYGPEFCVRLVPVNERLTHNLSARRGLQDIPVDCQLGVLSAERPYIATGQIFLTRPNIYSYGIPRDVIAEALQSFDIPIAYGISSYENASLYFDFELADVVLDALVYVNQVTEEWFKRRSFFQRWLIDGSIPARDDKVWWSNVDNHVREMIRRRLPKRWAGKA